MILFGGEQEGQTLNDLWRFHFGKPTPHSLHCGYHSYSITLWLPQLFNQALRRQCRCVGYVRLYCQSSELCLSNLHPVCLFDTLVFGLPHYHKATVWESRKVGFLKVFLL